MTACARTVRKVPWTRTAELECKADGDLIIERRSLMRFYLDGAS